MEQKIFVFSVELMLSRKAKMGTWTIEKDLWWSFKSTESLISPGNWLLKKFSEVLLNENIFV